MGRRTKGINFHSIVKNKKLPILTIDTRWHELFPDDWKTAEIRELEAKVNNLLKRQGKLGNDIKDLKKLKSNLLKDIVINMDIGNDSMKKVKEKKREKNKQYIEEINEKIDQYMNELGDLPYQIKEANEALMAASVQICYKRLEQNNQELDEVTDEVNKLRAQIKEKQLIKQDLEERNSMIYTYMHDIFGAEITDMLDRHHN
jgi:DNA repair exonuclease SbcCD ATPase subunit